MSASHQHFDREVRLVWIFFFFKLQSMGSFCAFFPTIASCGFPPKSSSWECMNHPVPSPLPKFSDQSNKTNVLFLRAALSISLVYIYAHVCFILNIFINQIPPSYKEILFHLPLKACHLPRQTDKSHLLQKQNTKIANPVTKSTFKTEIQVNICREVSPQHCGAGKEQEGARAIKIERFLSLRNVKLLPQEASFLINTQEASKSVPST